MLSSIHLKSPFKNCDLSIRGRGFNTSGLTKLEQPPGANHPCPVRHLHVINPPAFYPNSQERLRNSKNETRDAHGNQLRKPVVVAARAKGQGLEKLYLAHKKSLTYS